jgi:hypothetical protein
MDVQGHNFGVSALLLLIAIIIFVLAAFGVHIGSLGELDLIALGSAVFAAAHLL